MKYVKIKAVSQDPDAPPMEIYAVLESNNRISSEHRAFGAWGKGNDDYCPFEFSQGRIDFGSWSEPRYYRFDLDYAPIKEGRELIYSASGYSEPSKTYRVSKVTEIALRKK